MLERSDNETRGHEELRTSQTARCDEYRFSTARQNTHLLHLLERGLAHAAFFEVGRRLLDDTFDDLGVDIALLCAC